LNTTYFNIDRDQIIGNLTLKDLPSGADKRFQSIMVELVQQEVQGASKSSQSPDSMIADRLATVPGQS
jgi:hypothetical protein